MRDANVSTGPWRLSLSEGSVALTGEHPATALPLLDLRAPSEVLPALLTAVAVECLWAIWGWGTVVPPASAFSGSGVLSFVAPCSSGVAFGAALICLAA